MDREAKDHRKNVSWKLIDLRQRTISDVSHLSYLCSSLTEKQTLYTLNQIICFICRYLGNKCVCRLEKELYSIAAEGPNF